jgi:hypothetical protein
MSSSCMTKRMGGLCPGGGAHNVYDTLSPLSFLFFLTFYRHLEHVLINAVLVYRLKVGGRRGGGRRRR